MTILGILQAGAGLVGGGGGGGSSDPYSSNPRAQGFSLDGPSSGYPKVWSNQSGVNRTISDGVNTFTVYPGGRIQQLGSPVSGKLVPISNAYQQGTSMTPNVGTPNTTPAQVSTSPTIFGLPVGTVQSGTMTTADASKGHGTTGSGSKGLLLLAVILYFATR